MMPKEYYKLFDLCVESNIHLSITQIQPCQPDVIIEVDEWKPARVDDDSVEFEIDGLNNIIVDIHDMAKFTIKNGNYMNIVPHSEDYWENEIVTYIVGVAFATLLLQRDVFSIHGSAICANNQAFIIVGEAGAGKSSIAREFIQSGYKLLSDDLSAISTKNQLYVIPSFPTQKMWKNTMDAYESSPDPSKKIFHDVDKFYVDAQDHFEESSKQLGGIIWLEESEVEEVTLTKLEKNQALEVLLIHAFIEDMVEKLGLKTQQFILLSHVLSHVDVYHLERPNNQFTVKEQVRIIKEKLFEQIENKL
jgi:hypothetical protein